MNSKQNQAKNRQVVARIAQKATTSGPARSQHLLPHNKTQYRSAFHKPPTRHRSFLVREHRLGSLFQVEKEATNQAVATPLHPTYRRESTQHRAAHLVRRVSAKPTLENRRRRTAMRPREFCETCVTGRNELEQNPVRAGPREENNDHGEKEWKSHLQDMGFSDRIRLSHRL